MSSDQQVLAALAMKTGQAMRFFDLVTIVCGHEKGKRCFVCLGKHALFFMRQDLNGKIHKGGELVYAYVLKAVQDTATQKHLLLLLSENKPPEWKSERLFIQSDSRDLLLQHLRCNWQTDRMWRLGRVEPFPIFVHQITRPPDAKDTIQFEHPEVVPFRGFTWRQYQRYKFMVPNSFKEQPNAVQHEQTGEYADSHGSTLVVHVHEQLTLDQLKLLKRDHIRWVAQEYKANLVGDESHFYVLRNAQYQKRMNLAGDAAAWWTWELIIRTRSCTLICLLLRRQYIPPVCNCAQDLAVILRCPSDESGPKNFDASHRLARLVADSLSPDCNVSIYRDIVQVKLDALRYDEEAVDWIGSHLKLTPAWRKQAKIFVRSIIKIYVEDGAMREHHNILELPASEALHNALPGEDEWSELGERDQDLDKFIKELRDGGEGLPQDDDLSYEPGVEFRRALEDEQRVRNAWTQRMARFLAGAVDGGLLGPRWTLDTMLDGLGQLTEKSSKTATMALNFLLHMRPGDMTKPYVDMNVPQILRDPQLGQWTFDDRVMYSMLSTDFLRKMFGRSRDKEYFMCLANLLGSDTAVNLKAYICRIFMEMRADAQKPATVSPEEEASVLVVHPLVSLMRTGGNFLATYASAALVNLSNGHAPVKMALMATGVSRDLVRQLKTKDDDLICYTLMLAANLTKEPHNRSIIAGEGLVPVIYDLLTSSYHQCRVAPKSDIASTDDNQQKVSSVSVSSPLKEKILAYAAVVIGQMCNDEAVRLQLTEMYPYTCKCLLYIYEACMPGGQLACKVLFALKQLCANTSDLKRIVGEQVLSKLVRELESKDVDKSGDFLMQAVLLMSMLTKIKANSDKLSSMGAEDVLEKLRKLPSAGDLDRFPQRLAELLEQISRHTKFETLAF
mmetsp:Transcript_62084/g.134745  ORF Transcript_62084/g.134745 Transcript_62084/m.134745 type:complete len:900 (+) Transcript_62084:67-2766(+)